MSTQTRRELLRNMRQEYISAGRKKRQMLLDSLVAATGYNRKYATSLLNKPPAEPPRRRTRPRIYDAEVTDALKQVWIAANRAIECKSEDLVRNALDEIVAALPFHVLGLDTDNGSEFLNYGMVAWCNARNITFTRSRAYRKNDQAHVEEKNGSIVRRLVGYDRFEGNYCAQVSC